MKTIKVILITALMAIVSFGFSQSSESPTVENQTLQLSKVLPLEKALQNQRLAMAMYAQLTEDFLKVEKPSYTVKVKYSNRLYYINGKHKEWMRFFSISPKGIKR